MAQCRRFERPLVQAHQHGRAQCRGAAGFILQRIYSEVQRVGKRLTLLGKPCIDHPLRCDPRPCQRKQENAQNRPGVMPRQVR